jgi:C4-dicarboxylate-specific signal transduction histidine kinase
VPALFGRVCTLMSSEIEQHGIRLEAQCKDADLALRADPQQIEQVLINLIKNAGEALAGRADPRIELRGFLNDQGKVSLQVADNGPGIDPAHVDNIFVPFFTTKRSGSGVGLSISRQIMFLNKGLISVKTAPGEGCVFTLRFA